MMVEVFSGDSRKWLTLWVFSLFRKGRERAEGDSVPCLDVGFVFDSERQSLCTILKEICPCSLIS